MRHPTPLSHCIVTGLIVAVGALATSPVRAEGAAAAASASPAPTDAAAVSPARQLFLDGRKLAADGNYAEACPKLEESLRLETGLGTQFNLADCWEHIGRIASAHALFLGAAASAKAAGQAEREQVLRERAAALEPRLSRLVIEVKSADPKLSVKRDDMPLDSDSLGKAVAIDPGKYTIKARAPGKKDWEKVVEITGTTPITTVEIPELAADKPAKAVAAASDEADKPQPAPAKPAPSSSEPDRGSTTNYRALALAGVGVVGIGVGTVMGIKYLGANSDAKDICPTSHGCSIKEIQAHDRRVSDARSDRAWSYVGFGVGGAVLLGAGALWYFQRSPSASTSSSASLRAVPIVAPDGTLGAMLDGRF